MKIVRYQTNGDTPKYDWMSANTADVKRKYPLQK